VWLLAGGERKGDSPGARQRVCILYRLRYEDKKAWRSIGRRQLQSNCGGKDLGLLFDFFLIRESDACARRGLKIGKDSSEVLPSPKGRSRRGERLEGKAGIFPLLRI